jgi:hypothetical protein
LRLNGNGQECSPPSTGCTLTFPTVSFYNWSSIGDAVSDGDSRIYFREALIPTNGGDDIGPGSLITFR